MTEYEGVILAGSFLLIIGLLKFFTSVTSRESVGLGLFIFLIGGGILAYANTLKPEGMHPGDVPAALVKAIGMVFN